jgi:hypothetical protein
MLPYNQPLHLVTGWVSQFQQRPVVKKPSNTACSRRRPV